MLPAFNSAFVSTSIQKLYCALFSLGKLLTTVFYDFPELLWFEKFLDSYSFNISHKINQPHLCPLQSWYTNLNSVFKANLLTLQSAFPSQYSIRSLNVAYEVLKNSETSLTGQQKLSDR